MVLCGARRLNGEKGKEVPRRTVPSAVATGLCCDERAVEGRMEYHERVPHHEDMETEAKEKGQVQENTGSVRRYDVEPVISSSDDQHRYYFQI